MHEDINRNKGHLFEPLRKTARMVKERKKGNSNKNNKHDGNDKWV